LDVLGAKPITVRFFLCKTIAIKSKAAAVMKVGVDDCFQINCFQFVDLLFGDFREGGWDQYIRVATIPEKEEVESRRGVFIPLADTLTEVAAAVLLTFYSQCYCCCATRASRQRSGTVPNRAYSWLPSRFLRRVLVQKQIDIRKYHNRVSWSAASPFLAKRNSALEFYKRSHSSRRTATLLKIDIV